MHSDTPEQILHSWSAPVTAQFKRGKKWYAAAAIIICLCVAYGIYWDSKPFAAVALLIGLVYVLLRNHTPADVPCMISSEGISVGQRSLSWNSAEGFWFLKTPGYTELHVVPKDKRRDIVIQTGREDIESLRTLLGQYSRELMDRKERLIDTISRICKL